MQSAAQILIALCLTAWVVGCTQPNGRVPDGSAPDTKVDGPRNDVPLDLPDASSDTSDVSGIGGQGGATPDVGNPDEMVTKLILGKTCGANAECDSGRCIEGVCCSSACADKCSSCLMINTGKSEGTCAAVQAGADPHNDCEKSSDPCGLDGTCDGAGACRKAGPDVVCKPESCTSGQYMGPSQCDGKGACVTPSALSCGNFPCAGGRCSMTCSGSTGCLSGFYCMGTTCLAQKGLGSTCGAGSECLTGNCVEGVCCDGGCTGKCMSCLAANTGHGNGQCSSVKSGVMHGNDCQADGTACGLDGSCDGNGACRKATTQKTCATESCSAGKYTGVSSCDGKGTCAAPAATSCGAYACGGTRCKTNCSVATDCAAGNTCLGGTCAGLKPNGGACPSGAGTDCMSGICVGGVCCGTACPMANQSSCGFDGTCDATGACRKWSSGTQCGTAMCTADNKFVATRTCDGAGNCQNPTPDVCGQSACDPTTGCKKSCVSPTDCTSNAYCDNTGHCAPKKAGGAACGAAVECSLGNCAEGVCCDGACTGKCMSCLHANTNQADGQCRPVKNGQTHNNDCTATAKSTCGTDGMCDGAGACRKWPSGTVCKDASCINGNSQSLASSSCDGNGTCNAPGAISCQAYLCNPGTVSCRTTCGSSSECSSNAYCTTSSTCTTKKDPGVLCDASEQCKSGSCHNRCCDPSNTSCSCPQPNVRNHLQNPGFDTDLSSWSPNAGGGSLSRISPGFDDTCPVSGAARFSYPPQGSGSPPTIFQCVAASPSGNYNFGVSLRGPGHCILEFFPQAGCAGTPTPAADHEWLNEAWGMPTAQVFAAPDSLSARATCFANPGATFFDVDMIYLSDFPAQF